MLGLHANHLRFLLRMARYDSFTIEEAAEVAGITDRGTRWMLATLRSMNLIEVIEHGGGRYKKRRYRCADRVLEITAAFISSS